MTSHGSAAGSVAGKSDRAEVRRAVASSAVGGAAAAYLGYRAGFGGAQNQAQVMQQEHAAQQPPAAAVEAVLEVDRARARGLPLSISAAVGVVLIAPITFTVWA